MMKFYLVISAFILYTFDNAYCKATEAHSQPEQDDNNVANHGNIGLLSMNCGKYLEDPIVGAYSPYAHIREFPWMALLAVFTKLPNGKEESEFGCEGTIINSKYILTAAHCVKDKKIAGIRVGEYDIRTSDDCEGEYPKIVCENHIQNIIVEKSIIHENYQMSPGVVNDIALIRVKDEIDFTFQNVAPVCLPALERELINSNLNGKMATIAGWGITERGRSMILNRAFVQVASDATPNENKRRVILAGNAENGTCESFSGSPLMLNNKYNGEERMIQYGIMSYGPALCRSSIPATYTDVRKIHALDFRQHRKINI